MDHEGTGRVPGSGNQQPAQTNGIAISNNNNCNSNGNNNNNNTNSGQEETMDLGSSSEQLARPSEPGQPEGNESSRSIIHTPQDVHTREKLFDFIALLQGRRMDDQRAILKPT